MICGRLIRLGPIRITSTFSVSRSLSFPVCHHVPLSRRVFGIHISTKAVASTSTKTNTSTTTMAPSHYTGATPSTPTIDPRITTFFSSFYATSDSPSEQSHLDYANSFTRDADFYMGPKYGKGYDTILEMRKALWSGPVKTRKHTLVKIFPFGEDAKEVMVYGFVEYGLKNGKDVKVDWAGRAEFVDEGGEDGLKFKLYQVYLDSAPVANALKD
jgi:hypothetical protein